MQSAGAVTALIASILMERSGKRTALANLVLNLVGVALFVPFARQLAALASRLAGDPGMAVATAHLVFNLGGALVALPAIRPLARWLEPARASQKPEARSSVEYAAITPTA